MEDRLSFALLAPDESFDNLDQLHLESRTGLDQSDGFSLALLVPAADVVFRQLHRVGIALRLARFRFRHRLVPRSRGFRPGRSYPAQQVVGNIVRIREIRLSRGRFGRGARLEQFAYSARYTVRADGDGVVSHRDEMGGMVVRQQEDSTECRQSGLI